MTFSARWEFDAIGTRWAVETEAPVSGRVRRRVGELVAQFDEQWSRFRSDSLVARLSAGGSAPLPADGASMLDLYARLSDETGGAVNPLVGRSLDALGYDPAYSFVAGGAMPAPAAWRDILHWHDDTLSLDAPAVIDVGAIGKGRLVDRVSAALAETHDTHVVDASGDIAVYGVTERIGLEHPYDPSRAIGVATVASGALCASAVNRRAWGDGLHHVLDARTGEPVRTVAATWAIASDAMTADAAATALFFDEGPRAAASLDAHWVRMTTDGQVEWSPDAPVDLFF